MTAKKTTKTAGVDLTVEVSEDGVTGGLQVALCEVHEDGGGTAHLLAGPEFNGTGRILFARRLTARDAQAIRFYLNAVFPVKD